MDNREWQDVTEDFFSSMKELKLGELIKKDGFSLLEAMSAIEMMDPKMDTGMVSNKIGRKILNLEQSVRCGKVKINNLNHDELIGIVDETYACLVTWLEGHSLAHTVMTNLYLHEPDRIEDKYLRVFSYAILKIIDIFKDIVTAKYCFEEEDFQPNNYGFNLATNISDAKVIASLKDICDHLECRLADDDNISHALSTINIENKVTQKASSANTKQKSPKQQKQLDNKCCVSKSSDGNCSSLANSQVAEEKDDQESTSGLNDSLTSKETLSALSVRFRFTKHLYHSLMIIRKDLICISNNSSQDQQNQNSTKSAGLSSKRSVPNVINICDNIERNLIQCQKLIELWKGTLNLGIMPSNNSYENSNQQHGNIVYDNLEELGKDKKFTLQAQETCSRERSPVYEDNKDKTSVHLSESHQNADYPTIMGFEPLINQRLPPTYPNCPSIKSRDKSLDYLNTLSMRLAYCCQSSRIFSYNEMVKFMNHFSKYFKMSSCVISRSFLQLIYIPNRDLISIQEVLRQSVRDMFDPAILQPKSTILAAKPKLKEKVDSFFAECAVIFSRNLFIYGHNTARQREKLIDHLESLKMLQYKAILIDEMIGVGGDSNYFSYWIEILGVAKNCLEAKDALSGIHDKSGGKSKNGTKIKPPKHKKRPSSPIHNEYAMTEALKSLSGGIFSLVAGLKSQSKIYTPKSDYTSEQTVFRNRFKCLPKTFYDQYLFAFLSMTESDPYNCALGFFAKAKALLELIPESENDITAYLKVAKTNLIIARLLSSNPGVSSKVPEFDFSVHPNFPIVKII